MTTDREATKEWSELRKKVLKAAGGNDDAVQEAIRGAFEKNPNALPDAESLCRSAKGIARDQARLRGARAATSSDVDPSTIGVGTGDSFGDLLDAGDAQLNEPDFGRSADAAAISLLADFAELARRFVSRAIPHCHDATIETIAQLLDRARNALEGADHRTLKKMAAAGKNVPTRAVPLDKTDRIRLVLQSNHRHLSPERAAESVLATVAYFYPEGDGAQEFGPARIPCLSDAIECFEPPDAADRDWMRFGKAFGRCQNGFTRSPKRVTSETNVRHKLRQWDQEHSKPASPADERTWRDERSNYAVTAALTEFFGSQTANKILALARAAKSRRDEDERAEFAARKAEILALVSGGEDAEHSG